MRSIRSVKNLSNSKGAHVKTPRPGTNTGVKSKNPTMKSPINSPQGKFFGKKRGATMLTSSNIVSGQQDGNQDGSYEFYIDKIENRCSPKERKSAIDNIIKYVDTTEQLDRLCTAIIECSEINISVTVKMFLKIRKHSELFPKQLYMVFASQIYQKLADKKVTRMFKDALNYSFLEVGPVKFLNKMRECYFEGNYFSGRNSIVYYNIFYESLAKAGQRFIPVETLVCMIRGFGYLHSTSNIKDKLGLLRTLLDQFYS